MQLKFLPLLSIFLCSLSLQTIPTICSPSNPLTANGKVLELDESNFDTAISTFDFIFVDFMLLGVVTVKNSLLSYEVLRGMMVFYWICASGVSGHELDTAAPMLASLDKPIVIAKVNADKFRRLGSKYEIDGFPTLKIFMHGVPVDYYGPRKADLLVRFLKKFVAPDVSLLESDEAISNFVKMAGTYFPIYIGFGLSESVISELAVEYKKKAWFSVAKDFSEETMLAYNVYKVPALVAFHPSYNEQNVFYGPFEDNFLRDYIKQNLLPLVLPINYDTLKLLNDDDREMVLTIVDDESDDKSLALFKLLRAAASANRDLIFGFIGFKQWEDFTETFEVNKKTKLPKMVVWNRNEEYLTVIDSESLEEEDQGSQITRFLEGYRSGRTEKKRISGPSLLGFINSLIGVRTIYIIVFVVAALLLIQKINKSDDYNVPQTKHDDASELVPENESGTYRPEDKED
ncbi:hypothetical protein IFM89_001866 [Coptis chinensis]|uniref:Thioredoxin domain-containing protein n=1 Tax=Coptis chinensis TaxID=261450 RepID=A0A835LM15_9MAGN|nr:hypothetical protein IFM89_001866 [Coptis chinensis]